MEESARTRLLGWLAVLALAIVVAAARMHVALADPEFDASEPSGMLKSDPALLYHLVDRMVEAGGHVPDDFAHDRTLEYPDTIDIARRFPLGPLRVVAWSQRLFGGETPLHVTASWVSAMSMGLALLGVFLLARELTRSTRLALLAALFTAATPAFHRSIGFILVDEDFFWPLFALHLGLALRAARVRTFAATSAAAIAAALALTTWHAAGFFLSLEAFVAVAWLLWTGRSPLNVRGGVTAPLALIAASLLVPFLDEARAVWSIPVAVSIGLYCAARANSPRAVRLTVCVTTVAVLAIGFWRAGGDGAYGHVYALLRAKIDHLGMRPPTAEGLSPDVRILWQGPFETPGWAQAIRGLSVGALLGIASTVWAWSSAARERREPVLAVAALYVAALAAAWFAQRALVLPALIAPALVVWAAARLRHGFVVLAVVVTAQLVMCVRWAADYANPWYHPLVQRQTEIRWMVETVERIVPRGEAVAADFMSSTAILARSGNPICFSPKWEAAEPRRRAAEFIDAFHHRTPAEFRALLVDRYRARWLVVDRYTLQYLAHWSAGLPADEFDPIPGTAAAALLARDDAALRSIPGYELVARSPSTIRLNSGAPSDFYRIYRLVD